MELQEICRSFGERVPRRARRFEPLIGFKSAEMPCQSKQDHGTGVNQGPRRNQGQVMPGGQARWKARVKRPSDRSTCDRTLGRYVRRCRTAEKGQPGNVNGDERVAVYHVQNGKNRTAGVLWRISRIWRGAKQFRLRSGRSSKRFDTSPPHGAGRND